MNYRAQRLAKITTVSHSMWDRLKPVSNVGKWLRRATSIYLFVRRSQMVKYPLVGDFGANQMQVDAKKFADRCHGKVLDLEDMTGFIP